jgi:hypothetical protein
MKAYKILLMAMVVTVGLVSCTRNVYVYKKMPPGQAKKVTGQKSAKPYAPGQQKKRH